MRTAVYWLLGISLAIVRNALCVATSLFELHGTARVNSDHRLSAEM